MGDTGKNIIYALCDPITDEVRYIGKSTSGMSRPGRHTKPAALRNDDTYKGRWLRSLVAMGTYPAVHVLSVLESPDALADEERRWILYGRASCWPLTNCTEGGDGCVGPTPEVRAKMRASHMGKVSPRKGVTLSEETKARMAAARVGRKLSEEHKANIGRAHLGKKRPPEVGARIAAAKLGMKYRKREPSV